MDNTEFLVCRKRTAVGKLAARPFKCAVLTEDVYIILVNRLIECKNKVDIPDCISFAFNIGKRLVGCNLNCGVGSNLSDCYRSNWSNICLRKFRLHQTVYNLIKIKQVKRINSFILVDIGIVIGRSDNNSVIIVILDTVVLSTEI